MSYQLITNDIELDLYCQQLQHATYLALDSEFVRTRTFYPHIGLLQVFDGEDTALIDPLTITDWQVFIDILKKPQIEKYFHACSEDLEVFAFFFGFIPSPIVDSQILASFLDNPLSGGYASLVSKYLGIDLDKSETRTDWLKRPLSDKQCLYAANDVYYLAPLVEKLKSLLLEQGTLNIAYEECRHIIERKSHPVLADNAYLNIKNGWQLKGAALSVLQKLAKWRFDYAKSHDIALNFVIHEEVLFNIAKYQPTSLAELDKIGMKGKEIRLFGSLILSILAEPQQTIAPISRAINYADYKQWATKIKGIAESISQQTHLNCEVLVSRRHIEQFVKWLHHETDRQPELLTGWRGKLFSPYLSELLSESLS